MVTVVGYALGDAAHTTFAVVGLSALVRSSAIAFQLVDLKAGNTQLQMLVLGVVFMLLGMLAYFPLAYFSGTVGRWIQTRQVIADRVRWITGSIFELANPEVEVEAILREKLNQVE